MKETKSEMRGFEELKKDARELYQELIYDNNKDCDKIGFVFSESELSECLKAFTEDSMPNAAQKKSYLHTMGMEYARKSAIEWVINHILNKLK